MEKNQREMALETEYCKKRLIEADKVLLEFRDLEDGMSSRHADQLYEAIFPRNATSNCQNPTNTFKLWLSNNTQMNEVNQRSSTLMESRKGGGQDGSLLEEDYADEDDDVLYNAAGERFEVISNSDPLQNEEVCPVSDQSSSTDTEDKNQLDANTSSLNGCAMSNSRNMGWEPPAHEDLLSNNQNVANAEHSNIEGLQQSLPNDSQMLVSKDIEESIVSKQLEEESQLLNGDNDPVFTEVMKAHDAGEETISVEDEAAWIQSQRCIEGEEQYRLVKLQLSDRGKREENKTEATENNEEWKKVIYRKITKHSFGKKREVWPSKKK